MDLAESMKEFEQLPVSVPSPQFTKGKLNAHNLLSKIEEDDVLDMMSSAKINIQSME